MQLIKKLVHRWKRFQQDESGPTSVEYAVMLAMIIGVCIATVNSMAQKARQSFDNSAKAIDKAIN